MIPPPTPRTAAGRALLRSESEDRFDEGSPAWQDYANSILAIEAEAADAAIATSDSGEMAGWMQREEDAYQRGRAEAAHAASEREGTK